MMIIHFTLSKGIPTFIASICGTVMRSSNRTSRSNTGKLLFINYCSALQNICMGTDRLRRTLVFHRHRSYA